MQASKDRSGTITKALLASGTDVGARDSTGSTPLHRYCMQLRMLCTHHMQRVLGGHR